MVARRIDVEMVVPEVAQHLAQLPAAVRGAQQRGGGDLQPRHLPLGPRDRVATIRQGPEALDRPVQMEKRPTVIDRRPLLRSRVFDKQPDTRQSLMNVGIRRIVRSELAIDPGSETGLLQFRHAFGRRPERQTVQSDDRERRRCTHEPIKIPETGPARPSCSSLFNRASLGILRGGIGEQGKDVFAVAALAQRLAQSAGAWRCR